MKRRIAATEARISILGLTSLLVIAYAAGCGKPASVDNEPADNSGHATEQPSTGTPILPVNGQAWFRSDCPFGSVNQPFGLNLELYECPIGLPSVELADQMRPLVIRGDCKDKTIHVRTLEGSHLEGNRDDGFNTYPDGSFSFTIYNIPTKLANDGNGNTACGLQMSATFMGKLECNSDPAKLDQANLKIETVWWLNKPAPVTPIPTGTPGSTRNTNPMPYPPNPPVVTPTSTPMPVPTATVVAGPTSAPTAFPSVSLLWMPSAATAIDTPTAQKCNVPASCYFYSTTTIKQCQ